MNILPDWHRLAYWGLLAALAAWLFSPARHPVHVEGFSASIVALGIHLAQGTLADFFPSQSFATEYFGLTKLGAVLGVAGFVKLGLTGEAAMRMLMVLGTILLVGGSARLVRHWSGAPWPIVFGVLLLIPGVVETSFFFNESMLGAGLLMTALALFCARRNLAATLTAGALIGMAIAVRTDLILMTPAVLLIACERETLRKAAITTTLVGIATLASLWLIYASVGASPLDAVRAGAKAVELWDRSGDLPRQAQSLLLFLGLPTLMLYLLGIRTSFAAQRWPRLTLLFGMPLFFNLVLAGKIWEVRQLLPLTPFFATLAAHGVQRLVTDWRLGHRRTAAAFGAMIAAILLVPPAIIYPADGPRALFGRIGSITSWHIWQANIRRNFALIDRVIAMAPTGQRLVVLTDYWDEDRYLHLRLLEQGFRATAQPRACDIIGQSMTKNGRIVLQISPHQNFLRTWETLHGPRLAHLVAPCLRAAPGQAMLVATIDRAIRATGKNPSAPPVRRLSDTMLTVVPFPPLLRRDQSAYHTVQAAYRATRASIQFGGSK
jgi:uncharacterized membrane protein YqjE